MADLIDYIFQFPDKASAQADQFVGPVLQLFSETLIYNPVSLESVDAAPGFWCMITAAAPINNNFVTHPNIQIINDRTLYGAGQPSALFANPDVSSLNVMVNVIGVYVSNGLGVKGGVSGGPRNSYVLEDGKTPYVAEDSTTYYVQET